MEHARSIEITAAGFAELTSLIDDEGKSLDHFRRELRLVADRHSWTWLGYKREFNKRTLMLYKGFSQQRHCAGRERQLADGNFTYWVYRCDHCEQHSKFNGLYLPPTHEFWTLCRLPMGWHCSCAIYGARSELGALRLGGSSLVMLPADWRKTLAENGDSFWLQEKPPTLLSMLEAVINADVERPDDLSSEQ